MDVLLSQLFKEVVETPTEENLDDAQKKWEESKDALVYDDEDVDLFYKTILVPALRLHGPAPLGRSHPIYPWDIFEIQRPWSLTQIKDQTVPSLICALKLYIEKQKLELRGLENMRIAKQKECNISNRIIRDWRCSICQEGWKPGTELVSACGQTGGFVHAFHRDCIAPWARSDGSCPKCRGTLNLEPVKNVLAHGGPSNPILKARFGGLLRRETPYTVNAS